MKLVTFSADGAEKLGVVVGPAGAEAVLDLAAAAARSGRPSEALGSMLALIGAGPKGLDRVRAEIDARAGEADLTRPLGEAQLLAPIPVPPQMLIRSGTPRTSKSPARPSSLKTSCRAPLWITTKRRESIS